MDNKYHELEQKIKDVFIFCSKNNINFSLTYGGNQNLFIIENENVIINIYDIEDKHFKNYLDLKLTEL
jgi:hypothetical protein